MVLADLSGGITERLESFGNAHVLGAQADVGTGKSNLGETGADRRLSSDKCGASGSATLLAIPVGEHRAFPGDAVDVRRTVTHDPMIVGADIEPTDVVGHDHENVGPRFNGLGRNL